MYAFPPHVLLPQTLEKLQSFEGLAIVVARYVVNSRENASFRVVKTGNIHFVLLSTGLPLQTR